MEGAEAAFEREMARGYATLKREINYNAVRFKQMLDEHGGVETARRLDMSIEASVLKPEFEALFTDDERRVARHRLESYGFDVGAFLRDVVAT